MCLYPELIRNRKYTANKKNGGIAPPIKDPRTELVPVACGNCKECRKQKAREWMVRLSEDIKTNKDGVFITLTFSTESIIKLREYEKTYTDIETGRKFKVKPKDLEGYEQDNEIAKIAVRLFNERWRKEYKTALRHWLVTELGHNGTENIHLHGIIWTKEQIHTIRKIWNYGYIWPRTEQQRRQNYVNGRTVNYITKYVSKRDQKHKEYKSIILTSPGIGSKYTNTHNSKTNKYKGKETDETYTTSTGHKIALPIYWRNKIYTEEEKEKLWINKLDKEERWIGGEKIKVNTKEGIERYFKILEHYRNENKQLGYGDNEKNWSREVYENQRRIIVQHERLRREVIKREQINKKAGCAANT